ncbi:MAG: hypothetical protein HXX17_17075 [Geobacteraceae bacterium]|nr:hypothetical protein [Geobacteraceae bacterium]
MNFLKNTVIFVLMTLLTACGGGGGGGGAGISQSGSATISGVASKGIIRNGTVAIYPVSATGVKASIPLATGRTDADGFYSINIGSYSGPVVVEASGVYTDEATGKDITIPASAPLHAALNYVTSGKSFSMPVTALTELAYRQAGALTPANITAANDLISYVMRIDIINTRPVAPTAAAFATASQNQKDYSLILAAISQIMATEGTTLDQTLAGLNSGLSSTATATTLNSALTTFIANGNNHTGVATVPATLLNIGTVGKKVTLQLSGSNISVLQAIAVTFTLPGGLLLRTDSSGEPLPSVYQLSSAAAAIQNIKYTARYVAASGNSPATIALTLLAPVGGFSAGDIMSIICDSAGSATSPITLSDMGFWDQNGATLSGPALNVH